MDLVISKNCYNFIALIYKDLQTIIAMITESKVIELFCMADDFCKFFDTMMTKYTLKSATKRKYHRDSTLSKAEIMLIMILFHDSGYRCLKHFYQEKLCRHMRHHLYIYLICGFCIASNYHFNFQLATKSTFYNIIQRFQCYIFSIVFYF